MSRIRISVLIDRDLDRKIEHLAIDLGRTKYKLYELGARILVELLDKGELSKETNEALKELREKLEAYRRQELMKPIA